MASGATAWAYIKPAQLKVANQYSHEPTSKFLSKQVFVGLVGYGYQQITDDFGAHPILGGFRSRVLGIGPQIGFLFPLGDMQGYLNLKGYGGI